MRSFPGFRWFRCVVSTNPVVFWVAQIMSQWRMCLDGTSPFRVSKKQFLIVNSTEAIKHTSSVQLSCCPPGHPAKPSSWRDFLGLPVWRLLHHKILHLPLNSTTAFSRSHLCSPDINSAIPVVVPLNWRRSATILTTIHPHLWSVGHRETVIWWEHANSPLKSPMPPGGSKPLTFLLWGHSINHCTTFRAAQVMIHQEKLFLFSSCFRCFE